MKNSQLTEARRRRWQLIGAILMFIGFVFKTFQYFNTSSSLIHLFLGALFLISGIILYLQSKDIIKSR